MPLKKQLACMVLAGWTIAVAIVSVRPAFAQEISGPCAAAVGSFLTVNTFGSDKPVESRSLLAFTNGGHAFRFDSDETQAALDRRTFGDSLGRWRCDGVDGDSVVRLTTTMLDFTFAGSGGQTSQIVRLDASGRYVPSTGTLELEGKLHFVPIDANADDPEAASIAEGSSVAITLTGKRIALPPAP